MRAPEHREGREIILGGVRCYVAGEPCVDGDPNCPTTAVIVMHDVFGPDTGNHFLVCDALAKRGGHYVVMPDFYDGWSIEPFYQRGVPAEGKKELKRYNWEHCSSYLEHIFEHFAHHDIDRVGTIGFCWGAWAVAKACQDPRVHAGVWAHPSCQVGKELYEGETEHELAAAAGKPTLILPTPQDEALYYNGELAAIFEADSVPHECVKMFDQTHGFMVRAAGFLGKSWVECGGSENARTHIGQQRGINLSLGWFAKHLYP